MPGLDALLRATLQDCPDAVLVHDDVRALSGRAFDTLVQAAAAQLRHCGIVAGDRVLLAMDFGLPCLVALFAALRAGVEPALIACGTRPIEMAARAKAAGAVALAGPTSCGSDEFGEAYLSAAAMSDAIRLVATLGPGEVDGAVDLSVAALQALAVDAVPAGPEASVIVTFEQGAAAPVEHHQGVLFAQALALVDAAGINPSKPLLSTILPATAAGLVAGPFAALIGASSLALHGPFAAAAFLRACEREPGAHLVVPAAIAPLLEEARVSTFCGSITLLSRHASPAAAAPPTPFDCSCPVIELHAVGESVLISRARIGGLAELQSDGMEPGLPAPLGAALNRARTASAGS